MDSRDKKKEAKTKQNLWKIKKSKKSFFDQKSRKIRKNARGNESFMLKVVCVA